MSAIGWKQKQLVNRLGKRMDFEIALGTFYSQSDEARLFQGLSEIGAVEELEGVGVNLIISLNIRLLSKDDLCDLIAVLFRYGIPLAPLYVLAEKSRFAWLNDKEAFWYKSLFDKATRVKSRKYTSNS